METTKTNLWNKKLEDLTVRDAVVMNVVPLAVIAGGSIAIVAVSKTVDVVGNKIQGLRIKRQTKTVTEEQ